MLRLQQGLTPLNTDLIIREELDSSVEVIDKIKKKRLPILQRD